MPDIIITPSIGKLEFIDNSAQVTRRHSFTLDHSDGLVLDAPLSAAAIIAPLNVINVTVNNSNVNYPFVLAQSGETGAKNLLMDGAGGTYNPFTNTATIDISGNSATATLASNSTNLGGVAAASYVTLTGTQTLTNKTITGTFTGNLTGTGSWATNAVSAISATTATNSTQLNGQAASYYTNIPARLGYTPVNKAGDTISGNLTVNGNFAVNGSVTAFSASNIYITSSNLTVTDNILLMNALSPYQRYAGIQMYDSGSGTLSQLLWDGDGDYFFLTGSSVNGKIITGPDGQTNLTSGYIPKATAGYKLGNSLIYDNGTNVGIGTTSPGAKLDVVGSVRSFSSAGNYGLITNGSFQAVGNHGGTFMMDLDNTGEADLVNIKKSGVSRFYIKNNGNIGIGTTSPTQRLHVLTTGGSTTAPNIVATFQANTATTILAGGGTAIKFVGVSSGGNLQDYNQGMISTLGYADNNRHGMQFWVKPNASTVLTVGQTIDSNGNVGIGTTSPSTLLQLRQTSASHTIFSINRANSATAAIYIGNDSSDNAIIASNNTALRFGKDFTGTFNEYVRIDTNGNLGIGTTSPGTKLDVVGEVTMPVIKQSTTLYAGIDITDDNSTRIIYFNIPAGGYSPAKYFKVARIKITGNYHNVSLNGYFTTTNSALHVGFERKVEFDFIAYAATNPGAPTVTYLKRGPDTTNVLVYSVPNGGGAGTTYYDVYIRSAWYNDTNGELAIRVGFSSAVTVWQAGLDSGTSAPVDTLVNPNSNYTFDTTGNIGIGTTSPGVALHVQRANGDSTATFKSTSGGAEINLDATNGYAALKIYSSGTEKWRVGQVNDSTGFQIYQGGTGARLYINSSGNVGIGTSNPIYKFQVVGSAYVNAGTLLIDSGNSISWGNSTQYIFGSNGIGLSFAAGSATRMFVSSSGNIGIGTTNPTATLQVGTNSISATNNNSVNVRIGQSNAAGAIYGLSLANTATATVSNESALSFIVAGNYSATGMISTILRNTTTAASDLVFTNYNNALFERMRIQFDGNVGIGTTSPAYKLDVNGTFNATGTSTLAGVSITGTINSSATEAVRVNNNSGYISIYNSAGTTRTGYIQGLTGGSLTLSAENGALLQFLVGGTERLRIDTSGNVGIGTTSPSSRVHIYENANRVTHITQNNNHTARFEAYGTATAIDTTASNGIFFRINGGDIVKFAANGYVGINTNNPTARLQVVQGNSGGVAAILLSSDESTIQGPSANTQIRMGSNLVLNASGIIPIGTNGSERVRIDSSGNVGVGTTAPGQKLDVEGRIRTRGATGTGGFEIGAASSGAAKWRIEWDSASDSLDFNWVG